MDTDEHGLRLLRRCAPRNDMVWVGLFLLGVVVFQVHGQQYASQEGHALDANPGIGTFGLNVERRFDPLVPRVNLYITGNVRGGGRFQGLIGRKLKLCAANGVITTAPRSGSSKGPPADRL